MAVPDPKSGTESGAKYQELVPQDPSSVEDEERLQLMLAASFSSPDEAVLGMGASLSDDVLRCTRSRLKEYLKIWAYRWRW